MGIRATRGALAALTLLATGCLSVPESGDGGGGGDACGTLAALREPFEAEALGRWSSSGDVTVTGDRVRLAKAASEDAELQGAIYYTLAGSALVVQVGDLALGDGTLQVSLEAANGDAVLLDLLGTTITVATDIGATRTVKGAFDLDDGLFWRIAETKGEIVVSTSVEGLEFVEQVRFANPVRPPAVHVEIELEGTGASSAEILGLNEQLDADAVQPMCSITTLPAGLDDPDGREWVTVGLDRGCGVVVEDGVLTLLQPSGTTCAYETQRAFDLGDHAIAVHNLAVGDGGGLNFALILPSGDRYVVHVHPSPTVEGTSEMTAEINYPDGGFDILAVDEGYDLTADTYWAFEPVGGTIMLKTSSTPGDVASWPLFAQIDLRGQSLDEVRVSFFVNEDPRTPQPVRFDGLVVE